MNKSIFTGIVVLGLAASAVARAHTLDLNLNNDTVAVDYTTQIQKSEVNIGAGLLHHQDNGDVY